MLRIEGYKETLKHYSLEQHPLEWADTQRLLGWTYHQLSLFDSSVEILMDVIEACECALMVISIESNSAKYAENKYLIGDAYLGLILHEQQLVYCIRGIEALEEALMLETEQSQQYCINLDLGRLYDWAGIINQFENGDIEDAYLNFTKSINYDREALKISILNSDEENCYLIKSFIGASYLNLANINPSIENCIRSIKASEEALKYYHVESHPQESVHIKLRIGDAYKIYATLESKEIHCRKSIELYQEALDAGIDEEYRDQYAYIYYKLGKVYLMLSEIKDTRDNSFLAKSALEKAKSLHSDTEILDEIDKELDLLRDNLK